ncbi:mitochondrial carrier protein, putative [Plasmodium vinckei vinckei]|uniref:Mitochondrial carrier protein, putative n=1 Tax=Plasmodium vinckei vinckei TaxID=54757 RepID=A0A449C0V7_PLAVN|nr:mitochondrial carrier protein, putative [Plasmodium vinckei vinckei]VEV59327.1 mitochondrial carrier protein, putative [Plasmodium vinckei vinckei]
MEHLKNLITGALAGIVVDAILYPVDNLKTNIQAKNQVYSIFEARKLYNGIIPTLIGTIPASAFFYCFYEMSKKLISENNPGISKSALYIASTSIAELTASIVRLPFEIIKQKMQVSSEASVKNIINDVLRMQGVQSFLLRSYLVIIIRDIPFECIQYFIWETLKEKGQKYSREFHENHLVLMSSLSGGIAGATAGFLTTPIDVIKSKHIVYGRSYIETIMEISKEGYLSFYKGCLFRTCYLFFGGLIFFGALRLFSFKKDKPCETNYQLA